MHISHPNLQFHNPHITVLEFTTSNSPLRKEVQLLHFSVISTSYFAYTIHSP